MCFGKDVSFSWKQTEHKTLPPKQARLKAFNASGLLQTFQDVLSGPAAANRQPNERRGRDPCLLACRPVFLPKAVGKAHAVHFA